MTQEAEQLRLELPEFQRVERQLYGTHSPWLADHIRAGVRCPCCHQYVKLYRRTITSAMAQGLIYLYRYSLRHGREKSIQVEGYLKRLNISSTIRGDIPKLCVWGLLQKKEGQRKDGSTRNGHYYITPFAIDFLLHGVTVRKYALLYNNQCFGFEGPKIGIREALTTQFDYDKLISTDPEYL